MFPLRRLSFLNFSTQVDPIKKILARSFQMVEAAQSTWAWVDSLKKAAFSVFGLSAMVDLLKAIKSFTWTTGCTFCHLCCIQQIIFVVVEHKISAICDLVWLIFVSTDIVNQYTISNAYLWHCLFCSNAHYHSCTHPCGRKHCYCKLMHHIIKARSKSIDLCAQGQKWNRASLV